jgi:hypothetical protein
VVVKVDTGRLSIEELPSKPHIVASSYLKSTSSNTLHVLKKPLASLAPKSSKLLTLEFT